MTIEIKSFSAEAKDFLNSAVQIRFNVFFDEQGIDKDILYDGLDFSAIHYLVLVDNVPAASARWRETETGIKIERMAVLKKYRSLGIGFLLIKYILKELIPSKKIIYLHAQEQVINFYTFANFKIVGDKFSEANIFHYKMIYQY